MEQILQNRVLFCNIFLHLDVFIAGVPLTRKSFAGRPDCDHKSDGCRCWKERELCWQVSRSLLSLVSCLLSLVSCLSCWQEGLSLFQKDNITRRWIAPCLLQTAEVVSSLHQLFDTCPAALFFHPISHSLVWCTAGSGNPPHDRPRSLDHSYS